MFWVSCRLRAKSPSDVNSCSSMDIDQKLFYCFFHTHCKTLLYRLINRIKLQSSVKAAVFAFYGYYFLISFNQMSECDTLFQKRDFFWSISVLAVFQRSCFKDLVPFTVPCLEYAKAQGSESPVTGNAGCRGLAIFLIVSIYWTLTRYDGC